MQNVPFRALVYWWGYVTEESEFSETRKDLAAFERDYEEFCVKSAEGYVVA